MKKTTSEDRFQAQQETNDAIARAASKPLPQNWMHHTVQKARLNMASQIAYLISCPDEEPHHEMTLREFIHWLETAEIK